MTTSSKKKSMAAEHWRYDDDPACRFADIRFGIMGKNVDPDAITKLFELKPTRENKMGEPFASKTGRPAAHVIGRWCVESSKLIKSTSVEKNALALLEYLEPKKEAIRKFANSETPIIVMSFKWEATDNRYGGFGITSETMCRLCDLCDDIHFYFIGAKQGVGSLVPE